MFSNKLPRFGTFCIPHNSRIMPQFAVSV